MRFRAIVIEGEADPATLAAIRAALEAAPGSVNIIARANRPAGPNFHDMLRHVSFETGVPVGVILGPNREKQAVRARTLVAWFARQIMGKTYTDIADRLGNRDPSTIRAALRRARQLRDSDPSFLSFCDQLSAWFGGEK